MNFCPICGKSIASHRLSITYYVDGVEMTTSTAGLFGVGDMCQGHTTNAIQPMTYLSNSTVSRPNCKCILEPERTPIPQVFLDAFKDEDMSV